MKYINKKLTIEELSVDRIAKKYGTPAYCYSYNQFKNEYPKSKFKNESKKMYNNLKNIK